TATSPAGRAIANFSCTAESDDSLSKRKRDVCATLDAPSGVHNLRRALLDRRRFYGECFSGFLLLLSWKENDCRDHRDRFDPFCDRTSTRELADFHRSRLDQWLLPTPARSRPVTLGSASIPSRCGHSSHLRDSPVGN